MSPKAKMQPMYIYIGGGSPQCVLFAREHMCDS